MIKKVKLFELLLLHIWLIFHIHFNIANWFDVWNQIHSNELGKGNHAYLKPSHFKKWINLNTIHHPEWKRETRHSYHHRSLGRRHCSWSKIAKRAPCTGQDILPPTGAYIHKTIEAYLNICSPQILISFLWFYLASLSSYTQTLRVLT